MHGNVSRPRMLFMSLLCAALLLLFVPETLVGALRARAYSALSPVLEIVGSPATPSREEQNLVPASVSAPANQAQSSENPASVPPRLEPAPTNAPSSSPQIQQLLADLVRIQAENSRLRNLLPDQAPPPKEHPGIPGEIIARKVLWQEPILALNRGETDGVRLHAGVLHRGAVAGRIVSLAPHASCMALLTHKGMCVSARLADSRVEGVLQGASGDLKSGAVCRMSIVARELNVKPGEQVVTSGLDGAFPAGLWLGTVTAVKKRGDLQWELSVSPACAENMIEGVRVLTVSGLEAPWPAWEGKGQKAKGKSAD